MFLQLFQFLLNFLIFLSTFGSFSLTFSVFLHLSAFFLNFFSFSSSFSFSSWLSQFFLNCIIFLLLNSLIFSLTFKVFLQLSQYIEPKLFRPKTFPAQTFSNRAYHPATCASSELLRACLNCFRPYFGPRRTIFGTSLNHVLKPLGPFFGERTSEILFHF